ncbi:MAG: succinylglutamate desuccinylase/aspartoacylase family protein [Halorientalis sp.]
MGESGTFTYSDGAVEPGETADIRHPVSETYFGDPIRIPVTIINGERDGPTVFLSAAVHGDELNGIEVVREVAQEWHHEGLAGTLVCLPVLNVPAFMGQQRYLPIYDRDLNRSFPGARDGTGAERMAARIFENFIEPCDVGVDFHTSTRGRTNMLHVRADMDDDAVARLARAFASNVVIAGTGPSGSLRREASDAGVPTITGEMGQAHRFQRDIIDRALNGVVSVLAEYGLRPAESVHWPGWRTVVDGDAEKTWLRAGAGGVVEMHFEQGALVYEGDHVCTITNPFKAETDALRASFTGVLVGVLENPLVYPGNPICHLVRVDEGTLRAIERQRAAEE